MSIKDFTIAPPDSDGDCCSEFSCEIVNKSDEEVMLIKYDSFFFTGSNHLIACDIRNSRECLLEKEDSEKIDGWSQIKDSFVQKGGTTHVRLNARLFKREFYKLGPVELPEGEGITFYGSKLNSKLIGNDFNVTLLRSVPDDDGEVRLDFKCPVTNLNESYLESSELKVVIYDKKGAEIQDSSDHNDIPPHSISSLEPYFWGLKPKKIKGATFEVFLTVYKQISAEMLEGVAKNPG
jgi:hypothetical protein